MSEWVKPAYRFLKNKGSSPDFLFLYALFIKPNKPLDYIVQDFIDWQDRDRGSDGSWANALNQDAKFKALCDGSSWTPQRILKERELAIAYLGHRWNGMKQSAHNTLNEATRALTAAKEFAKAAPAQKENQVFVEQLRTILNDIEGKLLSHHSGDANPFYHLGLAFRALRIFNFTQAMNHFEEFLAKREITLEEVGDLQPALIGYERLNEGLYAWREALQPHQGNWRTVKLLNALQCCIRDLEQAKPLSDLLHSARALTDELHALSTLTDDDLAALLKCRIDSLDERLQACHDAAVQTEVTLGDLQNNLADERELERVAAKEMKRVEGENDELRNVIAEMAAQLTNADAAKKLGNLAAKLQQGLTDKERLDREGKQREKTIEDLNIMLARLKDQENHIASDQDSLRKEMGALESLQATIQKVVPAPQLV